MKIASILLVILFLSFSWDGVEGGHQVSSQLQKVIKPKDINHQYDCVDIYKQPAFDNILLKNHKIQMNPTSFPKINDKLSFDRHHNFQLQTKDSCPEGMVPIQRSRANKLADLSKLHLGNIHPLTSTAPGRHFAVFGSRSEKSEFYGAGAQIDLYNPAVKMNQVSMAQIWVEGGPPAELNSIQFGWAVNPRLYGDNLTHATAYWTADASGKTGCYNLMCPGFVQVHPSQHPGMPFESVSVIGGFIFATQPLIYKDSTTGNWWLDLNTEPIGYWPKEILPHLGEAASFVQYGGWTYNSPDGLSPPMGSGRFPNSNLHESCFFAQLQTMDRDNNLIDMGRDSVRRVVDNTSCYDAIHWGNVYVTLGETFTFGGPGGMCGI